MKVFDWFRPPRSVLTLYLAGAGVALGCLAWLANGQLQSAELVDAQRTQQRLTGIAEVVATRVRSGLGDSQRALSSDAETLPEGAAVVHTAGDRVRVVRGSLPFLPDSPASTAGDPDALASAETLEFASRDLIRAAAAYRTKYHEAGAGGRLEAWLVPIDGTTPRKLDLGVQNLLAGGVRISPDGRQLLMMVGDVRDGEIQAHERIVPGSKK